MTLPPITAEMPPTPTDPNRAPFNSAAHDRLGLLGLALGVLAGALVLIGVFGDSMLVSSSRGGIFLQDSAFVIIGVLTIVLLALSIALPWAWARITGIGVLTAAAASCFLIVIGARSDDRFLFARDLTLHRSAWILYAAGLAFTIALALAVIGSPRIGRAPQQHVVGQATSGYAVTALVLGICSVVTFGLTSALAIAFAIAGIDDIKRSEGTRGGMGQAKAGLVLGIVILAIVVLFGVIGAMTMEPSLDRD